MENTIATEVPVGHSLLREQARSIFMEGISTTAEASQENATFSLNTDHCPYDAEREFGAEDDDDMYCDGPGARTRSKMGQEPYSKLTAPSFLVQIPFYAQKKETNRKCSVCGKHGRTPSDLLRHMRVHTGERPFPCIGCDKKFKCKRSQLTHQYLTHGITDGLSSHRLQILELKKMRRPQKTSFPINYDRPVLESQIKNEAPSDQETAKPSSVGDQDEDTEIVAGEEMAANSEVRTTFEGYFASVANGQPPSINDALSDEKIPEIGRDYDDISSSSPLQDPEERRVNGFTESSPNNENVIDNADDYRGNAECDESAKTEMLKVPILRIKTHKCTHCKRQFRSIYTLRYHLRSMHDEKVYLSPALESRLKKRRWLPPHVRLQKPKINFSLGMLLKAKHANKTNNNQNGVPKLRESETTIEDPEKNIPTSEFSATFQTECYTTSNKSKQENEQPAEITESETNRDVNNLFPATVKTEKQDPVLDDFYDHQNVANTDLNNNSSTLRNILTSKESLFNQLHQYTSTFANHLPGGNNSQTFSKSPPPPYVVPPHIFLPSNPQTLDEGLEDNKPVSWESLRVTSENVLVTKMEAIHPTTQQKYVLYKCSQCGKAFSGLRAISVHLASHNENAGKDCEKCGASFKWQAELDSHMECHRADRKYVPSSQFLPSYYVNPFPIPVVPTGDQAVMSTPGLLSYPFFPMPQQLSPLVQPGFFPFFAAALQPSSQIPLNENASSSPMNAAHDLTDLAKDSQGDKNSPQNCSFQCKLCPKTFDRIFSLQRHERIHSGVKACFCKTCGRGFSELRNLRHHIVRFHADTTKMEPLPYRRQPTRVRSSSQRLVSFLKKTAVRILNSIGQSKMDPPASSVKIQTDVSAKDAKEETISEEDRNSQPHQDSTGVKDSASETDQKNNDMSDSSDHLQGPKKVVNYVKVPELEDLPRINGTSLLNDTIKNLQNKNNNSYNRPMEVLQDPKRSLLGNRRKGRPFKLTTNTNSCNFLNPLADENLFAITQKILNGIPKLNIETSNIFLPPPQVVGTNIATDLNMTQLSFLNTDIQNNEPLDMSSNRESKAAQECKVEPENLSESATSNDNKTSLLVNYSGIPQINDSLAVNGTLMHNSDGKCMFPCNYCHRSFSTLSDLNRHMTFHADIRPFKCPYCSYCSRTNSQLKVHMMRHEGIKHYMCQICNYNGVTQSDLNRHLKTRTHLLRSRNICACCGTGFHTRSLSEEHYKSCSLLGGQDPPKNPKESRLTLENKNRGNRLKHVEKPKEDASTKKEFFKNLYELGKMGVPFADFLQQSNATASAVK